MQRNKASVVPVSATRVASQTWVDRPLWTRVAAAVTCPLAIVARWLDLSSMVVKPVAPSGSPTRAPKPQAVSASVTSAPAWRWPLAA